MQAFLGEQARSHGVWLVGGTLPLVCDDAAKVYNATLVYDPSGYARLLQPEARGHARVMEVAEDMVAHVSAEGEEAR